MDEILRCLQGPPDKAQVVRFRPVSVRLGVVGCATISALPLAIPATYESAHFD